MNIIGNKDGKPLDRSKIKRIVFPYNAGAAEVIIPAKNFAGMISANKTPLRSENTILKEALQTPVSGPSFHNFLKTPGRTLVLVNDGQRSTPTAKILRLLHSRLSVSSVRFLAASGTHPKPDEAALRFIFGDLLSAYHDRIFFHDCYNPKNLVKMGVTRLGTPVLLNKMVTEADKIIVIGSVEPHYFAGHTGGRKAFLPGTAGFETIEQNHKLALSENSRVLALKGNPVHEDMDEALRFLEERKIFSFMTTLDADENIYAAYSGGIRESFSAAVRKTEEIWTVKIKEKPDVIVAGAAPPLDRDLYQAHKSIENTRHVLADDGIMILAAACEKGIGPDTFVRLLAEASNPEAVKRRITKKYALGYHKSMKLASLLQYAQIWTVSELPPEILKSIFFRPFNTLQAAVNAAILEKPDARILFIPSASALVPRLPHSSL